MQAGTVMGVTTIPINQTQSRHYPQTQDPRLWLLLSPALPVGGYSYSHGLESAVRHQLIKDLADTSAWISTLAQRVLPNLDLPLVHRLLRACNDGDLSCANYWNDVAHATRESAELLLEETEKGRALVNLYPSLGITNVLAIDQPGFCAAYAQVCHNWRLPIRDALMGYGWVWFEMLTAAAIKLVPLGHTQGQRLLLDCTAQLRDLTETAMKCADDDIGASAPGLMMLSAAHETQPARQFRS